MRHSPSSISYRYVVQNCHSRHKVLRPRLAGLEDAVGWPSTTSSAWPSTEIKRAYKLKGEGVVVVVGGGRAGRWGVLGLWGGEGEDF